MTAAAAGTEYTELIYHPMKAAVLSRAFNVEVKTRGITSQEKSGRCWMFSVLNILREKTAEKCGLDFFEFSENYIIFYDKLEKANNMLEMAAANADLDVNDRKMEYLFQGFHDGGLWPLAVDLIKKYGLVPKEVMPETYQSSHTVQFVNMLLTLIRKDIMELRQIIREGGDPEARKEEMMAEIFKAECIAYGMPPAEFDFEYRDAQGIFHADRGLTPKEFYRKYVGTDLDAYVYIVNEPSDLKPMRQRYRSHNIGNMADRDVTAVNLPMAEIKELCIRQLKDGEPVFIGIDSMAFVSRKHGVWDIGAVDYSGVMGGADLFMNKKDRFESRASYAAHNVILTGVNLDENGKPNRWKIENSWGPEAGDQGYFVCGDRYLEEYLYEAAILRKYLNEEQIAVLAGEPVNVEPWQR